MLIFYAFQSAPLFVFVDTDIVSPERSKNKSGRWDVHIFSAPAVYPINGVMCHMLKRNWKTFAFWILLAEAVGALSGWLTRDGMKLFNETVAQPPLSPPSWLFPVVWSILYALMGIGAARVSLQEKTVWRDRSINLFVAQLVVNFFWSLIFFNAQAFGFAFFWLLLLWVLVLLMILSFHKVDPLAAKLQIPYLLWLTFAAYLNFGVWYLNR